MTPVRILAMSLRAAEFHAREAGYDPRDQRQVHLIYDARSLERSVRGCTPPVVLHRIPDMWLSQLSVGLREAIDYFEAGRRIEVSTDPIPPREQS